MIFVMVSPLVTFDSHACHFPIGPDVFSNDVPGHYDVTSFVGPHFRLNIEPPSRIHLLDTEKNMKRCKQSSTVSFFF